MRALSSALLALAAIAVGSPVLAQGALNVRDSAGTVAQTVQRLEAAIEARGATVVATVDHAANAATIEAEIPAATVVIFGNPALGTPLIAENPRVALELPQRILVWDNDGTTRIGYLDPSDLAERYDISEQAQAVAAMNSAMDAVAEEAAGGRQ